MSLMGTPIEILPYGNNCTKWPDPAETPAYVYVLFYGIKKGTAIGAVDAPNGHLFKVPQRPAQACVWTYWLASFGWKVQVVLDAASSLLYLADSELNDNFYFWDGTGPSPLEEFWEYDNWYDSEVLTHGYDGHGFIFWLTAESPVVLGFGFEDVDDLMLEVFNVDDSHYVLKFCSLSLHMNISVKIAR